MKKNGERKSIRRERKIHFKNQEKKERLLSMGGRLDEKSGQDVGLKRFK